MQSFHTVSPVPVNTMASIYNAFSLRQKWSLCPPSMKPPACFTSLHFFWNTLSTSYRAVILLNTLTTSPCPVFCVSNVMTFYSLKSSGSKIKKPKWKNPECGNTQSTSQYVQYQESHWETDFSSKLSNQPRHPEAKGLELLQVCPTPLSPPPTYLGGSRCPASGILSFASWLPTKLPEAFSDFSSSPPQQLFNKWSLWMTW